MIFHTSTDPIYFEKFYPSFFKTFKKHSGPSSQFSLSYIGNPTEYLFSFCRDNNIQLTIENKTLDDIVDNFKKSLDDCYGYYAINRWCTIPNFNQPVFVSDVDVFAINDIDINSIKDILNDYDVVNITRLKPNGTHGGMANIVLSEKICNEVAEVSKKILESNSIKWDLDVLVKEYIYKTFKIYEINNKVLDITKKSYKRESLDHWLILSKGGRNADLKIQRTNDFLLNNGKEIL